MSPVFDPDLPKEHYVKVTPKTDDQLASERMLPEGEYDFTIDSAIDRISKKGSAAGATEPDMTEVSLTVFSEHGDRRIKDWVMDKMAWKLKHFCYAIGMGDAYEAGAIDAHALVGRSGRLLLKQGKPNGDYAARNEVKDYVTTGKEIVKPAANAASKLPAAAAGADEPPF